MNIPESAQAEWHDHHRLGSRSLRLIHECADPGDNHPIATALDQLRAGELGDDCDRRHGRLGEQPRTARPPTRSRRAACSL
jgi:hypothetical protein